MSMGLARVPLTSESFSQGAPTPGSSGNREEMPMLNAPSFELPGPQAHDSDAPRLSLKLLLPGVKS